MNNNLLTVLMVLANIMFFGVNLYWALVDYKAGNMGLTAIELTGCLVCLVNILCAKIMADDLVE